MIQTQTGASTYTFDSAAIAATPGGDNTLLNQVVLQAPDVAQDSFGQYHVRGEHDGLQYRINGIILPEGIAVFGQSLDPRLISSLSLITGALPAEYGLRTAGIIDITTKSGILAQGGDVALYGGSHGEIQPSFVYGGGSGPFSYFVSADFLRNDLGIESPDGSSNPIHDHTTQYHGFGYFEDILDEQNRVALMVGSSVGKFQIPNIANVPEVYYPVNGVTTFPSQDLDESQREVTQFAALSWQHSAGAVNVQTSFIARYSSLTFEPDPLGDIIFTGISQDAYKQNVAYAAQSDASYELNDSHTLRAGVFLQSDHSISDTTSLVLATPVSPVDNVPISIPDDGSATEWLYSTYLQDEWKASDDFTVNYGVRLDKFTAYTSASQVSPRLNVVWKILSDTTLHAGYSRYLSPPPFELVGQKDVALFNNTTGAAPSSQASPPLPERANYYDIGVQQRFTRALTMGLDVYYKQSVDLIDEGQFGAPIILTPFNYRWGVQEGVELTTNYTREAFSAYPESVDPERTRQGHRRGTVQFLRGRPRLHLRTLYSPGPRAGVHRFWRRLLPVGRHALQRGPARGLRTACRLSASRRRRHSERAASAVLHAGQHRNHASVPHPECRNVDGALRCDQPLRSGLSNPQRYGRRRRRAAIRTASRVFLRPIEVAGA